MSNNNNHSTSSYAADEYEDDNGSNKTMTPNPSQVDTSENIDHILDNMFVQRAPHYPPTTGLAAVSRKSSSPTPAEKSHHSDVRVSTNANPTTETNVDSSSIGDTEQKATASFGELEAVVAVSFLSQLI